MSEKKKTGQIVLDGFGGVDLTKSHDDIFSARSIENFRLLNDGSLEKRPGYRYLADLGEPVRTVYGCAVNGEYKLFALVSQCVFTVDPKSGDISYIGNVKGYEGNACFFFFRESLYLLDGKDIYEYTEAGFEPVLGYVPLVAKDWTNNLMGETYEPRNILNRHARATYLVSDPPSIFMCVGEPVESVEAVYVNGAQIPSERYSINNSFYTVNVQGLSAGDSVEIHFTYANGYDTLRERLCACTSSALFGGIGKNRIFLCGNNGSGTVFGSKNVTERELTESRKHYPESNCIYFPLSYEFEAGDGLAEVRAITRQYEHLLIFTENDVWMVTPDDDNSDIASTTSVNGRIGCPAVCGATLSENEPVSIGYRSVYAWETSSQNRCDPVNISRPIDGYLGEEFLKNCGIYYDTSRNELWLYSRSLPVVWIFNTVRKSWYKYTGICADTVFDLGGSTAFLKSGKLYVFDETQGVDTDEESNERIISAVYTANCSEFGSNGKKILSAVTLSADLDGDELCFEFDVPSAKGLRISARSRAEHSMIRRRCASDRFTYAAFSLSSNGRARPKIHSLTLDLR